MTLEAIAQELALDIEQAMRDEARHVHEAEHDRGEPEAREYAYASGYEPCTRAMALEMMGARVPFDDDALVRMEQGKERERALNLRLKRAEVYSLSKYEVVSGQKRIMLTAMDGGKLISGKCEGEFEIRQGGKTILVPYEIKDWYPPIVDRINTFADLLTVSRWTRKGAYQFAAYLWGADRERGLFILNRKGMPKILPTTYEECLPLADEFMGRAEVAREAVRANRVPDFPEDFEVCKQCPLNGQHCFPPLIAPAAEFEFDEERIAQVARYVEVAPSRLEGNRLWDKLRAIYRGRPRVFAGFNIIEGKRSKATTVQVVDREAMPPAVQAQIKNMRDAIGEMEKPFTREVEKEGAWRMTIKPIAPEDGVDSALQTETEGA